MSMQGEVPHEAIWECLFPGRKQTVEEELLELEALIPDIAEVWNPLFKEAVTDSIANLLDENEARALVILISSSGFESPAEVYEELDSILCSGSEIVKGAIFEEFRAKVHLLLEKVKKVMPASEPVLFPPASIISQVGK